MSVLLSPPSVSGHLYPRWSRLVRLFLRRVLVICAPFVECPVVQPGGSPGVRPGEALPMSPLVSSVVCRYVVPWVKLCLFRLHFSAVVGRVGGMSASQAVFAVACSSGCLSLPSLSCGSLAHVACHSLFLCLSVVSSSLSSLSCYVACLLFVPLVSVVFCPSSWAFCTRRVPRVCCPVVSPRSVLPSSQFTALIPGLGHLGIHNTLGSCVGLSAHSPR